MSKLQGFDPTTGAKEKAIAFVLQPDLLRNLRVGPVENTKFNSDKPLAEDRRYSGAEIRRPEPYHTQ